MAETSRLTSTGMTGGWGMTLIYTKSPGMAPSLQGHIKVGEGAGLRVLAAAAVVLAVAAAEVGVEVEAESATISRTMENADSEAAAITATTSAAARHLSCQSGQGQTRAEGEGEGEGSPRVAAVVAAVETVAVVGTAVVVVVVLAVGEAVVEGVFVGSTTPTKDADSARTAPCATSKDLPNRRETCSTPAPWEIRKTPWYGRRAGKKTWFRGVMADLYFVCFGYVWRIPEDGFNVLFVRTDGRPRS